ncbi:MAG: SUMF1/EgtB/PvdO family nonheme iron enzyme [Saprospiraceae bacterium]|nr:SUMF1/EgtB/PvdO family nonheme iron enzyme [Saprospiraceae bacterium]
MKRQSRALLLMLVALGLTWASCGKKENGQLLGAKDRPTWKGINPFGMVYIPSGEFHAGPSDEDMSRSYVNRPKSVSIQGFFMDDTEITNNEYRQFIEWVRDSLAHVKLDHYIEGDDGKQIVDWEQEIDWEDETLADLFYQGKDKFDGRTEYNAEKFVVEYEYYDWQKAAHYNGNWQRPVDTKDQSKRYSRQEFIVKKKVIVYPDTLSWIRDFAYSYNEPMTRNYFWHPAFDDYPVIGVNWHMARAFCWWRTKLWNTYRGSKDVNTEDFRLPTEFEWEYAARGGHDLAPYPWGGYYTRNSKGCLLANFKPGRGNYPEDGGMYTVKADAYFPNDYGLYNMAGNVAEWTITAYTDNTGGLHDLEPDYRYDAKDDDPPAKKRKVIRGGSWKDIAYFLQTGTRTFEFQDTTKSYIGFRCALTFLGRSINDF